MARLRKTETAINWGPLDLDEHAAFWARDDGREGVADGRFVFSLDNETFVARRREIVFARRSDSGHHSSHSIYAIDGDGVALISSYHARKQSEMWDALNCEKIFRPFCPPEIGARYGAAFYPDGTGKWFYRARDKSGNLAFLSQSSFRYNDGDRADFLNWSARDFLADCQEFWQTPDSEMRRAFEFDKLPIAQRDAQALSCHNATPDELRALMGCVGQLLWDDNGYGWMEINFERWPHELKLEPPLSERELRGQKRDSWMRAILIAVQARYLKRGVRPTFVPDWIDTRRLARIKIAAPTAHEQLEAHLQLRDFARIHLPEVERKRLLD